MSELEMKANPIVAGVINEVTKTVAAKVESIKDSGGHPLVPQIEANLEVFKNAALSALGGVSSDEWTHILNLALARINTTLLSGRWSPEQISTMVTGLMALGSVLDNLAQVAEEVAPAAALKAEAPEGDQDPEQDEKDPAGDSGNVTE